MGRNLARICSRLLLFRYWVAESWPPLRMPLASVTLMFFTAFTRIAWAWVTAASAALFMLASSCVTWSPMPNILQLVSDLAQVAWQVRCFTSGVVTEAAGVRPVA